MASKLRVSGFLIATTCGAISACGSSDSSPAADSGSGLDAAASGSSGGSSGGVSDASAIGEGAVSTTDVSSDDVARGDTSLGDTGGTALDAGPTHLGSICPAVSAGSHESYGLPATTNLPAGVSSMTDWTQNPAAGGWSGSQIMDGCRYEVDPDGFLTWHGKPAVRVEVDPGDDPLALGEGTERAEDLTFQSASGTALNENESSGTQYFAFGYYFPATWAGTQLSGQSSSWSIVLQLHGPDSVGASPAFALSAAKSTTSGPEVYGISTNVGAITSGCCGPSYSMTDSAIGLGHWTDFVVMMTFASAATGHITLWRRDEGQSVFKQELDVPNVATLQYKSGQPVGDHYWKQGLYRGGVNRTDVLWLGPTVRGSSFAAVELAAFGTTSGP